MSPRRKVFPHRLGAVLSVAAILLMMPEVSTSSLSRGEKLIYGNFRRIQGFFLEGTPIYSASSVSNSIECSLKCVEHYDCMSFNYRDGGGTSCELLDTSQFINASALRMKNGFEHFYLLMDNCYAKPCKNNGECTSTDVDGNYTCACKPGFQGRNCEYLCTQRPLGMEDKTITDAQLSQSSYYANDPAFGADRGRLNISTWPHGAQLSTSDPNPWYKIDLLSCKIILAMDIQGYGSPNGASWTTTLQVSSSIDGSTWKWYEDTTDVTKTFLASTDAHTAARIGFLVPFKARMFKIWPKTCKGACTVRMEIYGCDVAAA